MTRLVAAALSCLGAIQAVASSDTGADVFGAVCAACHGEAGAGTPGLAPPLAGRPLSAAQAQVIETLLTGLTGPIVVAGESYDGVMPSFAGYTDEQLTAVANYVFSLGRAGPAGPAERVTGSYVGRIRAMNKSATEVRASRVKAFGETGSPP